MTLSDTVPLLGVDGGARRPALLARIADAVYWAGRYLERAEGLARIVGIHGDTHMDLPVGADVGWSPLLAVAGCESDYADRHSLLMSGHIGEAGRAPEEEVVTFVCCDMDNPSSVLSSLTATRANVRTARAVLPREAWAVMNALWRTAHERREDVRTRETRVVWLQQVLDGCGRLNGALWAAMPRDDVMAFFRAGQHLERADLTARLLAVRAEGVVAGPADAPYAEVHRMAVLRSLAAYQPFRRSTTRDPGRGAVARFLLRDEQFPRSVAACLAEVRRLAKQWPRNEAVLTACTDASVLVAETDDATSSVPALRRAMEGVGLAVETVHRQLAATYFATWTPQGFPGAVGPDAPEGPAAEPAPDGAPRPQRLPLEVNEPATGAAGAGGTAGSGAGGTGASGPAVGGPAVGGPAVRGPAVRGPAVRGPAVPAPGRAGQAGADTVARRYRVTHRTTYRYSQPALESYNEAHLRPRQTDRQRCVSSSLRVAPAPSVQSEYTDLFGNPVSTFVVEGGFEDLEVVAVSEVAITPLSPPRRTPPWETARQILDVDRQPAARDARRFRAGSRLVPTAGALAEYAAPSFSPNWPLFDAVTDLAGRIHRDFVYDPGFTSVTTPVLDVLEHRRGVCQDFAHLAIGCVRSVGLAARYVSGYIETIPAPGQERVVGADASHAWFAVFIPGWGWLDVDPTNDQVVSLNHVTTAWGRDYSDVAPLRGTVDGGGPSHELDVAVGVERLDPPAPADA